MVNEILRERDHAGFGDRGDFGPRMGGGGGGGGGNNGGGGGGGIDVSICVCVCVCVLNMKSCCWKTIFIPDHSRA